MPGTMEVTEAKSTLLVQGLIWVRHPLGAKTQTSAQSQVQTTGDKSKGQISEHTSERLTHHLPGN